MSARFAWPHLMNQSVMLIRHDGSTEHLFRLHLKACGYGFLVHTAHGRRGLVLQTETRTPERIPYEEALQLFTELLAEKTAEGYRPVEPYAGMEDPVPSPSDRRFRPQQPTALDFRQAGALLSEPDWWLQEKHRGQHLLITKTDESLSAIDAKGRLVPLPAEVREAAQAIPMRWIIEGVLNGGTFTAFDQPRFENVDFRSLSYEHRLDSLRSLIPGRSPAFVVAETAEDLDAKMPMYRRLRAESAAGVVFRKCNGVSRRAGLTVEGYSLSCAFGEDPSSPALSDGDQAAAPAAAEPSPG